MLEERVPSGWTVERSPDRIVLTRTEEIYFYDSFNLPSMLPKQLEAHVKKNGTRGRWVITLALAPLMPPEEFTRLKAQNEQIERRLNALRESMRFIRRRADEYLPMTPAEKNRVDEFHALQKTLAPLPDGRLEGRSVFLSTNQKYPMMVFPPDAEDECNRVLQAVEEALEKYSA